VAGVGTANPWREGDARLRGIGAAVCPIYAGIMRHPFGTSCASQGVKLYRLCGIAMRPWAGKRWCSALDSAWEGTGKSPVAV